MRKFLLIRVIRGLFMFYWFIFSIAAANLCLQGELEVVKEIPNKQIAQRKENNEEQNLSDNLSDGSNERDAFVTEISRMPFLKLRLDFHHILE